MAAAIPCDASRERQASKSLVQSSASADPSLTGSQGGGTVKGFLIGIVVLVASVAGYFAIVMNWSYSSGERAGWVQKFSNKGWVCKTWEGELALVSLPGTSVEKFLFTVRDDAVAANINKVMGQRVNLHYEQKVGLPTSCFGETRSYVTGVSAVSEVPPPPGLAVPTSPGAPASAATAR
jgi:hypothetical protein